jgi:hypothetical protein
MVLIEPEVDRKMTTAAPRRRAPVHLRRKTTGMLVTMRRSVLFAFAVCTVLGGSLAVSCAHGGMTGFSQVGGSSPTTSSNEGGSNTGGTPTTPTRTITSTDTSTGGSTGTTTLTGSGGAGGGCDHVGTMTCVGAMDITQGEFDADTGSDTRIEHGDTSAWFKLHVTEGSNLPNDMSIDAQLQSPPGMQYNLYIYGDSSGANCQQNPQQGFGTPADYHECWGDSFGSDDSQDRIYEVRYISGDMCGAEAQWTLTIRGNVDGGSCP